MPREYQLEEDKFDKHLLCRAKLDGELFTDVIKDPVFEGKSYAMLYHRVTTLAQYGFLKLERPRRKLMVYAAGMQGDDEETGT